MSQKCYKVILTTLEDMDRARALYVKNSYILQKKTLINIYDLLKPEEIEGMCGDYDIMRVHYMKVIQNIE